MVTRKLRAVRHQETMAVVAESLRVATVALRALVGRCRGMRLNELRAMGTPEP